MYIFKILALKLVPFTQWFLPSLVSTQLEFPGFPPVCVYLCGPPVCVRSCVCARQWPRRHPSVGKRVWGRGSEWRAGGRAAAVFCRRQLPVAQFSYSVIFRFLLRQLRRLQQTAAESHAAVSLSLSRHSLCLSLSLVNQSSSAVPPPPPPRPIWCSPARTHSRATLVGARQTRPPPPQSLYKEIHPTCCCYT